MGDTAYFVQLFRRHGDDLVPSALFEARDYVAAIGEALRRAQEDAAGAIAFAATRGREGRAWSALEIVIRIGDAPDMPDALNANV